MSSSSRAAFLPNLMLDPDDIAWIKATTNELNNLLQVISESGEVIESLSPKTEIVRFEYPKKSHDFE